MLTGADLIPEAVVEVAVRFGAGLLLQPDQLLPESVAAEVGEGGGDHWSRCGLLLKSSRSEGQPWLAGPFVHNSSHSGVAVLRPTHQPSVGCFAENSVSDGVITDGDAAAASCICCRLQGFAGQLAFGFESSLAGGQIEQPLGPVTTENHGLGNGDLGQGHSNHLGQAAGGQAVTVGGGVGAGHNLRVVVRVVVPLELIVSDQEALSMGQT